MNAKWPRLYTCLTVPIFHIPVYFELCGDCFHYDVYDVYLLVCLNVPACTILQCSSMASRQSREDIEKKKERERRQKIEAVWEARRTVTVSTARIVTQGEVDAAFHGLHWEVEYQGRGKGTAVRVYIQTHK